MNSFFVPAIISLLLTLSGCLDGGQETYTVAAPGAATCNLVEAHSTVSEPRVITAYEAENMMTGENVIILDVRTQSEFETGHVKNAVLLPLDQLQELAETVIPNKNYVILIYCRSGNRSNQAAHLLSEMGYTYVYDFGGIIDWHGEIIN